MSVMIQTPPPAKRNIAGLLGMVAVGLVVAASLFLSSWPTYTGETVSSGPGGQQQVVRTTATLIQINGDRIIPLLILPVLFAAAGLLSVRMMDYGSTWGKVTTWAPTVLLWLYVAAGSFTIGLLYLPAAAVLLAAAIIFSRRHASGKNAKLPPSY